MTCSSYHISVGHNNTEKLYHAQRSATTSDLRGVQQHWQMKRLESAESEKRTPLIQVGTIELKNLYYTVTRVKHVSNFL
jgi:hypothetical protein